MRGNTFRAFKYAASEAVRNLPYRSASAFGAESLHAPLHRYVVYIWMVWSVNTRGCRVPAATQTAEVKTVETISRIHQSHVGSTDTAPISLAANRMIPAPYAR